MVDCIKMSKKGGKADESIIKASTITSAEDQGCMKLEESFAV